MTDIERAIKHFQNERDGAIAVLDSGFGDKPNESPTLYQRRKLNAELAISALEKQIPKKPTPQVVKGGKKLIGNGWWCEGTTVYRCPCCNELISRVYDCCYKCGQALLWEGDSE